MGLVTNPFSLVVGETAEKAEEMLKDIGVVFTSVRVWTPGMCGTCDFRPTRLNLHVGEDGLVTGADLG